MLCKHIHCLSIKTSISIMKFNDLCLDAFPLDGSFSRIGSLLSDLWFRCYLPCCQGCVPPRPINSSIAFLFTIKWRINLVFPSRRCPSSISCQFGSRFSYSHERNCVFSFFRSQPQSRMYNTKDCPRNLSLARFWVEGSKQSS